jgi:hypothetical protein
MSCKHEYVETSLPLSVTDTTWTSVSSINYDKTILYTGFATDSSLYMVGNNYFLEINKKEELIKSELISENGVTTGKQNNQYVSR